MEVEGATAVDKISNLDAKTLPSAVAKLFEYNNFEVEFNIHVHGAQIDLVAKSKSDPFADPLYIEVTIEYVSTEKYGKDTTKFLLIRNKNPSAKLLCISSMGFTAFVKERAKESGVTALSYGELFNKFEKFSPYVNSILNDVELEKLNETYEEPMFVDSKGKDYVSKWLSYWRSFSPDNSKWLIVLGEYGTGKTSLTKVMQYRWIKDYLTNPANRLPIRIELRSFSRQFDAQGLLHHFLDTNHLEHIPVSFLNYLIKSGRVILILDGYDEMAQFLNARERRACLSALAELSSGGAKGILTSRPNYFTEAEELGVFEALYTSLEQNRYYLSKSDRALVATEKDIDNLISSYIINKFERVLQDLTPEQTESLIKRVLSRDKVGQSIILSILGRLYRGTDDGGRHSLTGKPVIITYLLDLLEDIRGDGASIGVRIFSEWEIYKLIIDRLMLRDVKRSTLPPNTRRQALRMLALQLSHRDNAVADEDLFRSIIDDVFRNELRRLSAEDRRTRHEELFEDLRSSATLTRAAKSKKDSWVFSHNSLREYLVVESVLASLDQRVPVDIRVPISDAMKSFAASIPGDTVLDHIQALTELWPLRRNNFFLGRYVSLLWKAFNVAPNSVVSSLRHFAYDESSEKYLFEYTIVSEIDFSSVFRGKQFGAAFSGSEVSESSFDGVDLGMSSFRETILDNVSFKSANLFRCDFSGSLIFECDLTDAILSEADFRGLDIDSNIKFSRDKNSHVVSGKAALGYLRFCGALTDEVDDYYVWSNHPRFPIVEKILERIAEQRNSQLRGLTQRGEARVDVPFAQQFMDKLKSMNIVKISSNDLVSVTSDGRDVISQVLTNKFLPEEMVIFLKNWRV